ncbi:MAG: BrnT family toxin [Parvibaculales bacterium]
MEIEVEWDEHNWPKCAKHGVSKESIEYVLLHDSQITPDLKKDYGEERHIAVGQNKNGRYVFIVFCRREEKLRPISAHYMHDKAVKKYLNQM